MDVKRVRFRDSGAAGSKARSGSIIRFTFPEDTACSIEHVRCLLWSLAIARDVNVFIHVLQRRFSSALFEESYRARAHVEMTHLFQTPGISATPTCT